MFRQDYILRLIEEFARRVGRVLQLLRQGDLDDADREIALAEQAIGVPPGLEQIDAASAAMVLGNGDKVILLARLTELRAEEADARGATADAARHRARAMALLDRATPLELTQEAADLRQRLAARQPAT
ncbi:MAG TPA: hypothetical protein VG871_23950 [Vicinamibacterales bacterium]|nr:hypothetical protein [Vicinamibacterales bacterium]